MKTRAILLLTTDRSLEEVVREVLLDAGRGIHVARDVDDAVDLLCRIHDLDLVIVDFASGLHGMTLLRAIRALQQDVAILVVTDDDQRRALACANGAAAGLQKPATRSEIANAVHTFSKPVPQLALL